MAQPTEEGIKPKHGNRGTRKGKQAQRQPPVLGPLPSGELHQSEADKDERNLRRVEVAFAGAVAIFAFVQVLVTWWQLDSMDDQVALMQQQSDIQRPWVDIGFPPVVVTPPQRDDKGILLGLRVSLKNGGEYPAVNVRTWVGAAFSINTPRTLRDVASLNGPTCNSTWHEPDESMLGDLLLPGEEFAREEQYMAEIPAAEIPAGKHNAVFIVVCVDYQQGNRRFKTAAYYSLWKLNPDGTRESLDVAGDPVPADKITVQLMPFSFAK